MKTLLVNALKRYWDYSCGVSIGMLSVFTAILGLLIYGMTNTTIRRMMFEATEEIYGEEEDNYSYTRKTKDSE